MEEILHVFGVEWRLLIVQSINFFLALSVLSYFLYRPVLRLLEERQEKIAEGVRGAEEIARQKEQTELERRRTLNTAEHEAERIVEESRLHGRNTEEEMVKAAQEKSARILEEATLQAREEARSIVEKSREEVARLAVLAAEKVLRTK